MTKQSKAVAVTNAHMSGASETWKTTDHIDTAEWNARRAVAVEYLRTLPQAAQRAIADYISACMANGINRKIAVEAVTELYKAAHPAEVKATSKKADSNVVTKDELAAFKADLLSDIKKAIAPKGK